MGWRVGERRKETDNGCIKDGDIDRGRKKGGEVDKMDAVGKEGWREKGECRREMKT